MRKNIKSDKTDLSFNEIFDDIKNYYPDLKTPLAAELNKLDEIYIRIKEEKDTKSYIIATVSATLLFLSLPILIAWCYEATGSLHPSLINYLDQSKYLDTHLGVLTGLSLFSFAALSYALIIHTDFFSKMSKWLFNDPLSLQVRQSDKQFILYQILMIYLATTVLIVLIHSYTVDIRPYTAIAARIWLLLPAIVLSVFPSILIGVLLSLCISKETQDKEATFTTLLRTLLLLLQILKEVSHTSQFSTTERIQAISHIEKAATLFRCFYLNGQQTNKLEMWTKARMNRIADNFLALGAWVFFPKTDSVKSLKNCLVDYTNIILSGALDNLNAKEIDGSFPFISVSRKRGYFKRLSGLIWLLILITLPILIYTGMTIITSLSIPTPLQTPAAISYSAWVATCLLAHIEELAPDARTTLIDVLRVIRVSKE